jgi:flagellar protein FlaH
MAVNDTDPNILTFNNPELDRRIGGLPVPCMMLMEGANDSGKTVISQQITFGALKQSRGVLFITTEDTTKGFINNMERLNWKITEDYLNGKLKVTSLNTADMKWDNEISKYYLVALVNYIKQRAEKYDIIFIDSLTHLLTHAVPNDILDFFSKCRFLVDNYGKSFIFSLHPYALPTDLLVRIRSFCDGHMILEVKNIRDRNALSLNIAKLKGASKTQGSFITFEVSPAYGIKILPFTAAKG